MALLVAGAATGLVPPVAAQTTGTAQAAADGVPPGADGTAVAALPLSLPESLAIALNERTELRSAALQTDAARERTRQVAARFYPTVDVLMTAQRNKTYDTFTGVTATGTLQGQALVIDVTRRSPRYTVVPTLQIGYDLYAGGRDSASMRNAQAAERSSALRADLVSRDILREVTVDYLRLGQAWQRWRTATKWAEVARERETATVQRLSVGRASELEARSDALGRAQRELDVHARAQDVALRHLEFIGALGRRPGAMPARPEDLAPFLANFERELDALDTRGVASGAVPVPQTGDQPEFARARADVTAARELIDLERAANRPHVSLFAQYTGAGRSESSFGSALGDQRRGAYALGMTVSINLFSGFLTEARVSEAQINAARLAEEARQIDTRLAQAHSALEGTLAQTQMQLRYAIQRREVGALQLQVAQAKAEAGRGLADDVAQARMSLDAIDAGIAESRVDVVIAQVRLQFASSKDAPS